MSKSAIPSPARSQGAAPRRHNPRRTLSLASPARSDTSAKLVSMVGPYINDEKFAISPMQRRSVLPDDTEIEAPRRASWWKRLEGSSRDILEALDTNKMPFDLPFEEEVEVEKEKQSLSLPESSDNESVASIVVPQRRLFNAKSQPQSKFGEMMGSRKSLGKTNLDDDNTIYHLPKNLFNKDKSRTRPVFPAALLNSTNKTLNKTTEPDVNERPGCNLFGQARAKRKKTMFTNFVMSESEDDSEIQHKVFGFKKSDNKRISSGARKRRMPSLTPSVTTDIDMDDWNLLPSSTMIGNGSGQLEVSRITNNDESEHIEVDQDATLTEDTSKTKKRSLNRTKFVKTRRDDDEIDKTVTNEDIEVEQVNEKLDNNRNKTNIVNKSDTLSKSRKDKTVETSKKDNEIDKTLTNEDIEVEQANEKLDNSRNKTNIVNKSTLSKSRKDKTVETSKKDNVLMEKTLVEVINNDQQNHGNNKNVTVFETSVEDQMAELHGENVDIEKNNINLEPTAEHYESDYKEKTNNVNQDDDMEKMVWNDDDDDKVNEGVDDFNQSDIQNSVNEKTNKEESNCDEENKQGNEGKSNQQDSMHNKTNKDVSLDAEENENDSEDNKSKTQDVMCDITTIKDMSQDDKGNENDGTDSHVDNNSTKDNTGDQVSRDDESIEENDEDGNEPSTEESDDNDDENEESEIKEMDVETSKNNDSQNYVDKSEERNVDDEPDVNNKTDRKSAVTSNTNTTRTLINASHKNVKPLVEAEIDQENEVVNQIKSPEAVLQNMSSDNMSFRPIGRSTSFRKSKVAIDDVNLRHTLIPIQESTAGSDGSRNSSTEGSGWDSHRTTRKTLRQTFGKDFTPRKSLRALVMEQSAKRQAEKDKNVSKINKTGNKTSIEDQRIRDKRVSNRNVSSDALPQSKSPALGISAHHVSPQISQPRLSYTKSVYINEPEILPPEELNLSQDQAHDDSGPEISMHASYGSGMSAVASHQESKNISVKKHNKTANKSTAIKQAGARIEPVQEEEVLDYDPSLQEDSTRNSSNDKSSRRSVTEEEIVREDSSPRISVEEPDMELEIDDPEEIDQEMGAESENEMDAEESEQDIEHEDSQEDINQQESEEEVEAEESQQEIPVESEQEEEQSEQEMENESEHDEYQQIEPESDREESEQEIEDGSGNESEQNESVNVTQESDPESDRDSGEQNSEMNYEVESNDQENSVPLESPSISSRQTERIVFDNEMSDQEIDYELSERVSRQITNDGISEQNSDGEIEEIEYAGHSRLSEQAENPNLSVGSKKTLMRIEMEKIAQENMEMRRKIREKVQNSLKQKQDFNRFMSPIQSKFPVGRIKKSEPIKSLRKPRKPAALLLGPLPKEFVEDMKYKPPKRFQPANAPWITKRLYKFLESKLEPKYDYRARVRAEALVQNIYNLTKLARRHEVAPQAAVDELKREMARLHVVTTHFDFYEFFHEFMPREVRVKVNPDVVNKIPMPRNGVFADILQARQAVG